MRMNLDRVRRRKVRFWAIVDSSVSYTLALPPLAEHFVSLLYYVNGKLGGEATAPVFTPLQMFFVCLSGTLISLWCVARYVKPIGLFALIDGWGRVWVSLLIVWFVAVEGRATRAAAVHRDRDARRRSRNCYEVYRRKPLPTTGGPSAASR